MNAAGLLLAQGPEAAPALIEESRITPYAALRRGTGAVARWIARQHAPPGSRVGILAENSPFFVTAYLGILHAGHVAVPLNPDLPPANTADILRAAGAVAVLASPTPARRLAAAATPPPCPVAGEDSLPSEDAPCPPPVDPPPGDLAALMFTSGSTGTPKGVMVTHTNLACNTRDIASILGLTAADRALLVLPLHYCFGLSVLHSHLLVGASVVLNNRFLYPETVLRDIQRHACTGLAGVPSTYQILLRKSRFKDTPLPSLRWLQQAGGRLPNALIEEVRRAQPQARFFTMYGQTEATARLSVLPPEYLPAKLGSIGKGLPSTRLEVITPSGQPARPGSDDIGEIIASGDNICAGYWNDPEESARYFVAGKLHTGDLARVDAEGFIHIVDRDRDILKCGGNRISPKEIEDVLAAHPDVVEVAVIGLPHDLLGEAPAAFVVPTPRASVTPDDLRQICRRALPAYKVPEILRFVPHLPHNSSGKVLKATLRHQALASLSPPPPPPPPPP